ncbi:MAG: hypothetical protein PVF47_21460 [Anaerolineae bacterium]
MFDRPPRYRTYMLTLWEERGRETSAPVVWRFRLEDPRTGKRRGFATMEGLVAALEGEMREARGISPDGECRRAGREGGSAAAGQRPGPAPGPGESQEPDARADDCRS